MLCYQFSTSGIFFSLYIVTINVKKKIKDDGIKNLDARLTQPKLKNLYMTEWWFCLFMSLFVYLQSGLVAVGTHKGLVQIWDAGAQKRVSTIEGHTARVGKQAKFTVGTIFIAWNSTSFLLCS